MTECVVHVITGLNLGGAERSLHTLLTGGLQRTSEHSVISLMGPGHYGPLLEAAGIRVICLNMSAGRLNLKSIWTLAKIIRDLDASVVQGWMYHGNLAATLACGLTGKRPALAWNIRQSLEGLESTKISTRAVIRTGALLSRIPEVILYNSVRAKIQHEVYGYASRNSYAIPNGFDCVRWAPRQDSKARLCSEFGIPSNSMVVGFVGRGHEQKDIPNLITAFEIVASQNSTARLICVGEGVREAHTLLTDSEQVIYAGRRSDMEDLMPGLDLLCLSSTYEGFPNVIGEAMACGVPCVTTDVGDAAEVVADTGWVVPPRDAEMLASALKAALGTSPVELLSRGSAARARIINNYSLASVVDRYRSLYGQFMKAS